jgi:DNA (cytosine-5)-methyltransferase 1
MGYARAGFEVVGVDIKPQPHYPFEFVQADAVEYLSEIPAGSFDVIHASPPCKAHTKTGWAFHFGYHDRHKDLLTPTRALLIEQPAPWVIENVPGAPMRADVMLCGSLFDLNVRRHRWFELSWPQFRLMNPCVHRRGIVSPHGNPNRFKGSAKSWAEGMDIDWMSGPELAQAIPPAYTEWIGRQLLTTLEKAA